MFMLSVFTLHPLHLEFEDVIFLLHILNEMKHKLKRKSKTQETLTQKQKYISYRK